MSSSRPNHLDLGDNKFKPPFARSPGGSTPPRDLPSPRSGDVPPALSPLDAFALQSRLLSQKFEESSKNGQRISRLPPLTIASELAKPRPGYFSSNPASASPASEHEKTPTRDVNKSGNSPEVARPDFRPQSLYPAITTFDDAESILTQDTDATDQALAPVPEVEDAAPQEDSSLSRAISPPPSEVKPAEPIPQRMDAPEWSRPEPNAYFDRPRKAPPPPLFRSTDPNSLAPPLSPPQPRSPFSIRSVQLDEDSDSLSIPGDAREFRSFDRKASFSSAHSRPKSPFSPMFAPPRSPSIASEYSGIRPRASINFSRPISRAGRPSTDAVRPSFDGIPRPTGSDSPPMRPSLDTLSSQFSNEAPPLPTAPLPQPNLSRTNTDEDDNSSTDQNLPPAAPSYTYSKWSLPRGRNVSRTSATIQDPFTYKFEWEQPVRGTNVTPLGQESDNILSLRGFAIRDRDQDPSRNLSSTSLDLRPPQLDTQPRSQSADRFSSSRTTRSHKTNPSFPPANSSPLSQPAFGPVLPSDDDTGTAKVENERQPRAMTRAVLSPLANATSGSDGSLTAEDHLNMGIKCHEDGALQKSTYHLRIAARAGNATAMLLYALACRHGWGMRANQAEGVSWLRKAVDSAGLEVASDEMPDDSTTAAAEVGMSTGATPSANSSIARRAHKAQLALSIYELGVSYMNGWGITQDKALALRCFEIAGGWGDGDALAEAGFCYAKGVGCKKDYFRAADYYRRAEKKGVEMAGNSWIYKDKYMPTSTSTTTSDRSVSALLIDDGDRKGRSSEKDSKDKKPRDKSRTRTIFGGRKKSNTIVGP